MFYNILDKKRENILPLFKLLKNDFYLAGGTALALQIGKTKLASVEDIACMKLAAIVSRSTEKDYVDLYFILQNNKLPELLKLSKEKFPALDTNLIIKSLTYFDDIIEEAIVFKNDKNISLDEVKTFLREAVKEYLRIS